MSTNTTGTEFSTDTILGMVNQYSSMLGSNVPYTYKPSTTLNSKYSCFPAQEVNGVWQNIPRDANNNAVRPSIGYFGIGINGFYNVTSEDEISPLSQARRPKATDGDLYRPIPVRCVPKEYDLTGSQQKLYRMRTEIEVDGVAYICYWLKKLTFESGLTVTKIATDGTETAYDISDDSATLNPVAEAPTTPSVITGTNKIVVSANVACELYGYEVLEAINVLYHGDLRRAQISEWGIYYGGDMDVVGTDNVSYTEAMYVQLGAKRCTQGVPMGNSSAYQKERFTIRNGNLLFID